MGLSCDSWDLFSATGLLALGKSFNFCCLSFSISKMGIILTSPPHRGVVSLVNYSLAPSFTEAAGMCQQCGCLLLFNVLMLPELQEAKNPIDTCLSWTRGQLRPHCQRRQGIICPKQWEEFQHSDPRREGNLSASSLLTELFSLSI